MPVFLIFGFFTCPLRLSERVAKSNQEQRPIGASVKLYANPVDPLMPDFSRLTKEGVTDGSGQVLFDYSDFYKRGQAGFAVLDIHAEKDSLAGDGIIRIEEEVANEELVVVEPI
ncbi:MAG: hypothetical protein IPL86_07990 [Flavobacteriales bacterium]|nr:hypothetical protein [Flavobacteriales bacterium]